MKFEVIDKNGITVMHTSHNCCIPDDSVLKQMQTAGYKFRVDNKIYSIAKLKTLVN